MTPISNSWLNKGVAAILSGIQDLELKNAGGGSARYRYTRSGRRFLFEAGSAEQLLPSTPESVDREVSIRLISGNAVSLYWEGVGEGEQDFIQLTPEFPEFRDVSDGGLRLNAVSRSGEAELVILIRQNVPINYSLGAEEMADVNVGLLLQTDIIYSNRISDFDIIQRVDSITGSDMFIVGHKMFVVNGFTPGEKITFNINATSAGYGGSKIEMQFIKPDKLIKTLFLVGINNFLNIDIPSLLSGVGDLGEMFGYLGKTSSETGGSLTVKPFFDNYIGRFIATNTFNNQSDTCIITNYQPNLVDLKQGGTFTLNGF